MLDYISEIEHRNSSDQLNKALEEWLKNYYFKKNPGVKIELENRGLFFNAVTSPFGTVKTVNNQKD